MPLSALDTTVRLLTVVSLLLSSFSVPTVSANPGQQFEDHQRTTIERVTSSLTATPTVGATTPPSQTPTRRNIGCESRQLANAGWPY